MTRVLLALAVVLCAACSKKKEEPAGPAVQHMSPEEVKRSEDACKAYVDKVCECATRDPALATQCNLARALPDAVRLGLEIAASPDSRPADVPQLYESVRKTAKQCIEQSAKLPTVGCQ
jgi:hypothetical protein